MATIARRELPGWPEWGQPSQRYQHDHHHHHQSTRGYTVSTAPTSLNTNYQTLQAPSTSQAAYPLVASSYRVESPYSASPLPSVLPPPSYDHQGHYPSFSSFSHGVSPGFYYNQPASRSEYAKSEATAVPASQYTYAGSPTSSSPTTTPATPESCYTDYSATSAFSSASNSALELAKSRMRKAKTIAPTVSVSGQSSTVGQTPMDRIMRILSKKCYTSASSQNEPTPSPKGKNFLLDRRFVSPASPDAESPISPSSETSKVTKRSAKRFVCEVCGKTCAQRTGLDTHMRVHTGERPYPCRAPGCTSTFTQSGNRTTHEENHTGEKKFKCNICGRGFGQRGNRNGHVKRHHREGRDEKPFVCCLDECTKAFTELGNLKNHLNRYHKPTLEAWMARLELETTSNEDLTEKEREVSGYLNVIFKNLNKGIRGRGQSRYVSTARSIHDNANVGDHDVRHEILPAPTSSMVPSQDPRHSLAPTLATLQPQPYGLSQYPAYHPHQGHHYY